MTDQRPSRPFPAQFQSGCTGCGDVLDVGEMIRMHYGLPYHDNPECLPAISAWGDRQTRTYKASSSTDEPYDPW